MSHWIGFDAELLKDRNSSPARFVEQLGLSLLSEPDFDLMFFQKEKTERVFGKPAQYGTLFPHNKTLGVSSVVDLWHATHQFSPYLPTDKSIPVVCTVHELEFLFGKKAKEKRKDKIHLAKTLMKRCSAIVFTSDLAKQEAAEYLELPDVQQHVVGIGPSLGSEKKHKHSRKHRSPYFFFIGEIKERKNLHTLLPLLEAFPEYGLVLAGDRSSSYAGRLFEMAEQLGVADRLVMTGVITEAEKFDYYQFCEAFFYPVLGAGFRFPVREALHFGKPLFLRGQSGFYPYAGDAAFYWPSEAPDEMIKTVKDGLLAFHSGSEKKEHIKKQADLFSWKQASASYAAIYKELL